MVDAGTYIAGAVALLLVGLSVGFTAFRLRQRLLPAWTGAPARLVESVVAIALLIWLGELLGTFGLLYAWTFVATALLVAVLAAALLPGGGVVGGGTPEEDAPASGPRVLSRRPFPMCSDASRPALLGTPATAPPAGGRSWLAWVITVGVIGLVVAHWGLTTKDALDRGIFNFDSLWYHMPFAAEIAKSHATTGLHYTETVFTNWFYPQNSELLHALGILLTQRDTLSLFINFGFLGLAFLAAWCIGRPYGRGHLTVAAAAIVLECHTLVVREPGAAKNDLVAAALLLAAVAILVNAWMRNGPRVLSRRPSPMCSDASRPAPWGTPATAPPAGDASSRVDWAVVVAGLAVGLAVGTKSTAAAMAVALTVAVVVLAPVGRRWAAAGWWLVPAFLGGGYWYLRNLIVAGNPLPQATGVGPLSLPHPERLQGGRPDFSVAHYLTDTAVWRGYFEPGLHQAFGALWPLVLVAAVAGGILALLRGRDAILRCAGGVALFGLLAYLFTPLSAAGAEGEPVGFGINIRYAIPPLLLGLTLLPVAIRRLDGWRGWTLLGSLLAVLVITNRADAVLRDPSRVFAVTLALLIVVAPAVLLWLHSRRGAGPTRWPSAAIGFAALILLLLALGYPLQRDYLRDRFAPGSEIPGLRMDAAYHWARDRSDTRIAIVGTTAGFLQYGLYGTDLSNQVTYLGQKGPHGAYNAIPTCQAFRAAVNEAAPEYLITAPFLNFLHTSEPVSSPEAGWLEGDPAAVPIQRNGAVTIWRMDGRLDPAGCNSANAPFQRIPNTPEGGSG